MCSYDSGLLTMTLVINKGGNNICMLPCCIFYLMLVDVLKEYATKIGPCSLMYF